MGKNRPDRGEKVKLGLKETMGTMKTKKGTQT